jgi:hypothetical protein
MWAGYEGVSVECGNNVSVRYSQRRERGPQSLSIGGLGVETWALRTIRGFRSDRCLQSCASPPPPAPSGLVPLRQGGPRHRGSSSAHVPRVPHFNPRSSAGFAPIRLNAASIAALHSIASASIPHQPPRSAARFPPLAEAGLAGWGRRACAAELTQSLRGLPDALSFRSRQTLSSRPSARGVARHPLFGLLCVQSI